MRFPSGVLLRADKTEIEISDIDIYSTFHEDDYPVMRCRVSWSEGDDDHGTITIRSAT